MAGDGTIAAAPRQRGKTRRAWWLAVAACAVGAGLLADFLGLPAAWLLGPMVSTLALTLRWRLALNPPRAVPFAAQAVIGMALSASFDRSSFAILAGDWLPILIVVALTLLLSLLSGLVLARFSALDIPTAALGTVPGGASGMVAMSDDLDADIRLVAFMQYFRVVLVVLSVSLLTPAVADFGLAEGGVRAPGNRVAAVAGVTDRECRPGRASTPPRCAGSGDSPCRSSPSSWS